MTGSSIARSASRALASVALAASAVASEARELRGVWMAADPAVFGSRASIAEALDFLARHNVNVVFPEVWYDGVTLHPSAALERAFGLRQDPAYAGRDPLSEVVVEAHRRGIEVVPWFAAGFTAANAARPTKLLEKKPDWAARGRDGKVVVQNGVTWLNGFDPSVQEFVSALVLEVVRGYDVDGVQGDHRLPAMPATSGYDKTTAEMWRADKRLSPLPENDSRWIAWRAGHLTDFLAKLAKDVRDASPHVVVSSCPNPYRWGYEEGLQDTQAWLGRGLVDLFHPQCYRRDFANYQGLADAQHELLPDNSRAVFAPAIQIQSGEWRIEPAELVHMVEHNRDRGYGGELLFHYEGLRADDGLLARALLAGPYAEPARVPHRSMRWRPKAREIAPRALPDPAAWSRERGHVRADAAGAAEVAYALAAPTSAWFRVLVEVPDVADLPREVEIAFVGADVATKRVPFGAGLVDAGTVQLVDDARLRDRPRVELRLSTSAAETGRLAVGRALLVIDRKRSPDAVWRD